MCYMDARVLLRDTLKILGTEIASLQEQSQIKPLNPDNAAKLCAYAKVLAMMSKGNLVEQGEDFKATSLEELRTLLAEVRLESLN